MRKIRSSALMISLVVGIVLSGILVGIVLTIGQQTQSSAQARDGAIAYRAALSGIEDGLLRYKQAVSQGKMAELYGDSGNNIVIADGDENSPKISYDLSMRMDSISVGNELDGNKADVMNWYNDAQEALKQGALPLLSDDFIDLDLTYFINNSEIGLSTIEVFYSSPFVKQDDGTYSREPFYGPVFDATYRRAFTAMNYKLIDLDEKGEEQVVSEKTNAYETMRGINISNSALRFCKSCHLQIKPQVAFLQNTTIDQAANRLSGESIDEFAPSGKYVFIKIRAKDKDGNIIESTSDKPGTITIESVGHAGEAYRKLQAKIDASSGSYVGLLDFGIYCGERCNMPSVRRPE
jgi:hypothetical protein